MESEFASVDLLRELVDRVVEVKAEINRLQFKYTTLMEQIDELLPEIREEVHKR